MMRLGIRNQQTAAVDVHRSEAIKVPNTPVASRNMFERIKSVRMHLKKSKRSSKNPNHSRYHSSGSILRQLTLNSQSIGTISTSSSLIFTDWILRGLGPEFQQRQTTHFKKNPEKVVNAADIILSIPPSEMDDAIQVLDGFGSNILHLACYHGMDVHILSYILDNCSLESRVAAANSQDGAGNLPLFCAVESILRGKIQVRKGLEVVKRLFLINPKTISHFNHEDYMVSEFVYDHIRHMHRESEEYEQLRTLHQYLRKLVRQAYILQKKEWEESQESVMKLVDTDLNEDFTQLLTDAEDSTIHEIC
ncbi:predicted protein [Chaetoceros tenuissimus]|uniref:Uncharacterized protein n=1 Tax=Chaetoceros tenuissimus TaxID=426638 RepID=A0AAD3CEX7_9STRA|nr:predicted protein [Chaetoceros tenuissimus]